MPIPEEETRIEAKIIDAQATAPRLTPADIEAVIDHLEYWVVPGTTTTVCALVLRNGCVVTGLSACVDPANYRQEIGEEISYNKARQEIWQLEGYAMLERRAARA